MSCPVIQDGWLPLALCRQVCCPSFPSAWSSEHPVHGLVPEWMVPRNRQSRHRRTELGEGGWPLETRTAPPSSPGVLETPSSSPVGLLPLKVLRVDQGWFLLTPCVPTPPPCCACGLDCSLSVQGTHMSWQIRSASLSPQEHKPRATSSRLPGTLGV